ncbi:MAG TPA: s-methyl-5-thioribose-1-phosphate isomerase [Symbiobacteriaceae bacterium]|nr:s-methyl-5-thioribose-1-phosphate isomerase [Symbiobacteriaceae bacterium]
MAKATLPILTNRADTLKYEDGVVQVLDRRKLPEVVTFVPYRTYEEVAQAIVDMVIQGGPPLAYAAGYGLTLAARQFKGLTTAAYKAALADAHQRLRATRPTAGDIHPLMDNGLALAYKAIDAGRDVEADLKAYVDGQIQAGDRAARLSGKYASELLVDGDRVLTHCFAGAALNYMLYYAVEADKQIELICTETRPYLQGARLTAAQAREIGVPVTLVTDNMPGYLFYRGMITKYVTAADSITLDGHVSNKIGTFQYAVVAHQFGVPFIVLGYDGPDPERPDAASIPIEERNPEEVFYARGVRTAVEGIKGYYPAFDITPPQFVSVIATERGLFSPWNIKHYFDAPEPGAEGGAPKPGVAGR